MELLLCTDDHYAPYAATTMVSALENIALPSAVRVTLLTPSMSEENKHNIYGLARKYGAQARIIVKRDIDVNSEYLDRFGVASILRLFMHEHFSPECKRVIYLDCDMVVLDNLEEIWNVSLGDNIVAAVRDISGDPNEHANIETSLYFNSGLIVVDLQRWREQDVAGLSMKYFMQHAGKLNYPDQDALNHVLAGQWYELEPKWNLQSSTYAALNTKPMHLALLLPALEEALRDPSIIHYTGHIKPWHAISQHPLKDIFRSFSHLTPWPLHEKKLLRNLSLRERLRLMLKARKIKRRRKLTNWVAPGFKIRG